MAATFQGVAAAVGGDPMDLPCDRVDQLLGMAAECLAMARGDDLRSYVAERHARLIERRLGL